MNPAITSYTTIIPNNLPPQLQNPAQQQHQPQPQPQPTNSSPSPQSPDYINSALISQSALPEPDKQAYLAAWQQIQTFLAYTGLSHEATLEAVAQWQALSKRFYAQLGVARELLQTWDQQDGELASLVAGLRGAMREDAGAGGGGLVEQGVGSHGDADMANDMLEAMVDAERMGLEDDPDGEREFGELVDRLDGPSGGSGDGRGS